MLMIYYVYLDPTSKTYEIYQTRETNLIGTYESLNIGFGVNQVYYFACFTRSIDASDYVRSLNAKKGKSNV